MGEIFLVFVSPGIACSALAGMPAQAADFATGACRCLFDGPHQISNNETFIFTHEKERKKERESTICIFAKK